jgi:hypothetical protein
MILDLNKEFVKRTADYIESFFPKYYGSIAATLFESNPFKYPTRILTNGKKISGVLSVYYNFFNVGNVKLLAGDYGSMEKLIAPLKSLKKITITVPENLNNYIENLKKIGFSQKTKIYSKDLDEEMIGLSMIP